MFVSHIAYRLLNFAILWRVVWRDRTGETAKTDRRDWQLFAVALEGEGGSGNEKVESEETG